jgi:hypothetical protein
LKFVTILEFLFSFTTTKQTLDLERSSSPQVEIVMERTILQAEGRRRSGSDESGNRVPARK